MSLLARIAETQGASKAASQEQKVDRQVEATKPDANQVAAEGRNAYSQAMVEGADEEITDEKATPEEQEVFTKIEMAMAEKIYGREASSQIVESLKANQDPVKNVGDLASQMILTMEDEFGEIEEEVEIALLETAVEQMIDVLEASDDTVQLNDDQMAEAFSIALTVHTRANPERVDNEAMQGFASAAAPAQTGGRPNNEVTNQDNGAQPTQDQAAQAEASNDSHQPAPIERM